MDYLAIANAPIFWALCGITVVISLAQALLFMRQAKRAAVEVNLEQGLANKAFKIGLISAIGPACGVFIVMVGLMALLRTNGMASSFHYRRGSYRAFCSNHGCSGSRC